MKSNKTDKLKSVIQYMIRQEVKSIIQEEINKAMGKVLVEMVREIKTAPVNKEIIENSDNNSKFPLTEIKTNNPKLSEALNETAKSIRNSPRSSNINSLVSMMDGEFEKIGGQEDINLYEEPTSNIGFVKKIISENVSSNVNPSVLDSKENLPEHLQNLFSGKNLGKILKKSQEPGRGSNVSLG